MESILTFKLKNEKYIFYKDKILIKLGEIRNNEILEIREEKLPIIKEIIDSLTEEILDEEKLKEQNFEPIETEENIKETYSITIPLTDIKEKHFFYNCKYLNENKEKFNIEETQEEPYENKHEKKESSYESEYETQEESYEDEYENQEESYENEYETQEESYEDEYENQEETYEDEYENQEETYEDEYENQEESYEDEYENQEETYEDEYETQEESYEDEYENQEETYEDEYENQEETYEDEYENQEETYENEYETQEESYEDEYETQKESYENEYETQEQSYENEYETQEESYEDEYEKQEETYEDESETQKESYENEYENQEETYENEYEKQEETYEDESEPQEQSYKREYEVKDDIPKIQMKEQIKETTKRKINYKKVSIASIIMVIILIICLLFIQHIKNKKQIEKYLNQYKYEQTEKIFNADIKTIKIKKTDETNFYDSFIDINLENNGYQQLRSTQDTEQEKTNIYENETSRLLITKINNETKEEFIKKLGITKDEQEIFEKEKINDVYNLIYNCLLSIENNNQSDKYEIQKKYILNKYAAKVVPYNTESTLNKYIILTGDKTGFVHITDNGTEITLLNKETIKINYNKTLTEDEITKLVSSVKYKNN